LVTGRKEKETRDGFSKVRSGVDQAAAISQEPFFRAGKSEKANNRVAGVAVVGL